MSITKIESVAIADSAVTTTKLSTSAIDGGMVISNSSITLAKLATDVTYGLVPIGAILAWLPGYFNENSETQTYTNVTANVPAGWRECDGTLINDSSSPFNNGGAGYLPLLSGNRFLMGSTSSGSRGGSSSSSHTHDIAHGHGFTQPSAHGITDATYNMPGHSHSHAVTTPNHTHGISHTRLSGALTGGNDYVEPFGQYYNAAGYVDDYVSVTSSGGGVTCGGTVGSGSNGDSALACSKQTGASLTNNHSGGSVTALGTTASGGASATENRPLYLSCKYIIRIK